MEIIEIGIGNAEGGIKDWIESEFYSNKYFFSSVESVFLHFLRN